MQLDIIEKIHNVLMFAPTKELVSSPKNDGIEYEEIFIDTPDKEKLHGYFLPASKKTKNTMLYLHGNADNVTSWYKSCFEIQKHVPVNALVIDYRGYGKSTGKPTRRGVIIDAQSMYQYLIHRGLTNSDISIYGMSIGGAIGLELAIREKVKSIVIQSSIMSIKEAAKDIYPALPQFMIKNDLFNSTENIKKINVPVFISHGENDETVSVRHSYKLYELANKPKTLLILKGAGHNDLGVFFNEEYFKILKELFL